MADNFQQAKQPLVDPFIQSDVDLAIQNQQQQQNMQQPQMAGLNPQFYPQQQPQQQFQQYPQYPPQQQQQFYQQYPPNQMPNQMPQTQFVQPVFVGQPQQPMVEIIQFSNLPTDCNGQMNSAKIMCPHCKKEVFTNVSKNITSFQIVCIIILICCFWPLFWIPLVSDDCYDYTHYCPQCRAIVGRRYRN